VSYGHGTRGGTRAISSQGLGAGATGGVAAPELPVPGGITHCYRHVGVCERTLILHLHLELICGVINQQYTYASGQGARWMQSYGKATRQTPRHRPRNEASITQRYAWHWHASTTLPSGESGQMHGSILVRVTGHKQYPDDAP
jgi:hypothetical protein